MVRFFIKLSLTSGISDIKIEFGIDTLVLKYLNIYVSRETLFATYTLHKMKIKSEIYDL